MTAVFKQLKSPTLSIVLQLTETTTPGAAARTWEVHDVERNRGFRVRLAAGVSADDAALEVAIGLAIERSLQTPPEKVGGRLYDVEVGPGELAASRR